MSLRHFALALVLAGLVPSSPAWAEDDHAGHGSHEGQAAPAADPHASHRMPPPAAAPAVPSAGPVLPPPTPEALSAAFPPDVGAHRHQQEPGFGKVVVDRLEAQAAEDGSALAWEAEAGWGTALDRLVVSSEGERLHGDTEASRHELFWQHASARWWETRVGARHDAGEGPGRSWAGVGVEGLAPQFVEVSVVAYAGEEGRTALTVEAEYEARLTNRLILQPRLELNAYGKDDPARGIGRGLAEGEAGLRLRFEVRREFAPYAGIEWHRAYGDTADWVRAGGDRVGEVRAVAGVRLWL